MLTMYCISGSKGEKRESPVNTMSHEEEHHSSPEINDTELDLHSFSTKDKMTGKLRIHSKKLKTGWIISVQQ